MYNLLELLCGKQRPTLTLKFCAYSNSIRQWPQNYLVAHWGVNGWVCEPDLAANKKLCVSVFKDLMVYDNKYQRDGNVLMTKLTLTCI